MGLNSIMFCDVMFVIIHKTAIKHFKRQEMNCDVILMMWFL